MGDLDLESGADAFFFDIHPLKMTTLRLGTTNEVAMPTNKKFNWRLSGRVRLLKIQQDTQLSLRTFGYRECYAGRHDGVA